MTHEGLLLNKHFRFDLVTVFFRYTLSDGIESPLMPQKNRLGKRDDLSVALHMLKDNIYIQAQDRTDSETGFLFFLFLFLTFIL